MGIATLNWNETPGAECRGGALTIGNFDGVHCGHAVLVGQLRQRAQAVGGPAVALTFHPPPLELLRPEQFGPPLTRISDRAQLLLARGADHVLILRTTAELLNLSAEEFFNGVIERGCAARHLVEGFNFAFGRNREGNVETLSRLCRKAGVGLEVVPPLERKGSIVSSSRIRRALHEGDVREAAELLGRPYSIRGRVVTGQGRGQKLGFPTANLGEVETLAPRDGVYAVRVRYNQAHWAGAANIGANATFGEQVRKLEVHLIGFTGNLVGQELEVDFLERLRDTRRFAGPAELAEQLRLDVEQARRLADAEGRE
jgi:riboflavin kinase/FMN adenylyltransferase